MSEKFRNSVAKNSRQHRLRSNFTKIGRREVGETMRCLVAKSSENAVFSPPFCARLAEDDKSVRERAS